DRELIRLFQEAANEIKIELAKGVYLASSGPTYETPAEVRAFKGWGADAVGMSTIPEALLGSAAGLRIAALSCISNFASGITDRPLSHEEVTDMTSQTMPKMQALLQAFFGLLNAS
ncbi:MAG: purine-nucleoside phosphorylase, partial [Verrucomicrobiota bacterium]